MTKVCDHTSVGMLVWNDNKLLLIERMKFPFGFAPPAGHVDDNSSYEEAAKKELEEEVGLKATILKLVAKGRKENACRREDGNWHYWKIYSVEVDDKNVSRSLSETKQFKWMDKEEINTLAQRTEKYINKEISEEEWEKSPGIEPVWYEWLKELGIIG